jgi:hypothetical protein
VKRLVASLVAMVLVASCSSGGGGSAGPVPTGGENAGSPTEESVAGDATTAPPEAAPLDPVPAPDPVPPSEFAGATPSEQAAAASAAFVDPATRVGAVVGSLAASGVPVIDGTGTPIPGTGSDTLGLPWVHVQGVRVPSPTISLPLSDVVRLFDQGLEQPRPEVGDEAEQFLIGIREGLTSDDAQVQFFSALVAATSLRLGGADPADPATTADQVEVDAPTMEVILGRVVRSLSIELAVSGDLADEVQGLRRPGQAAPVGDCSSDGMDGWGLWLVSKLTGGVDIQKLAGEGVKWDGVVSWIVDRVKGSVSVVGEVVRGAEAVAKYGNYFSASMSLLNLVYEIASISVDDSMTPDPLERNKRRSQGDGKAAVITVTVSFRPPVDPDTLQAFNCLLVMTSAIGNNATIPPQGGIAGVQVEVTGAEGFSTSLVEAGTIVLFGPATFVPVQVSNAQGQVTVPVQGRAQTRDYPDTAIPVEKQFSIEVQSELEPTGPSSAGKTLLDSFFCVLAVVGCVDAAADILKTVRWDLGELPHVIIDWQAGWVIDETVTAPGVTVRYRAVKCDSEIGRWTITIDGTVEGGGTITGLVEANIDESYRGLATANMRMEVQGGGSLDIGTGSGAARLVPSGDGFLLELDGSTFSGVVTGPVAQRAEERGYRRVWYAEHHNMARIASSATSVLIAHVAAHTTRSGWVPAGSCCPTTRRSPSPSSSARSRRCTPGRIDLGLGRAPGSDQVTMRALRRDPDARPTVPPGRPRAAGLPLRRVADPGVRPCRGHGTRRAALHPRFVAVRRPARRGARPAVRVRVALRPRRAAGRRRDLPTRVPALGAARRALRDGGVNVIAADTEGEAAEQRGVR